MSVKFKFYCQNGIRFFNKIRIWQNKSNGTGFDKSKVYGDLKS